MGGHKALPKANFGRALSYSIKSYVGPGCLSLPLAFQHSGAAVGVGLLLSLLVMVTWNLRSLVLCKRHYESQGVRSYADLASVTLGPRARSLVDVLVNACQLGVCAVYFDFVAENLNALLPSSWDGAASIKVCQAYTFPVFAGLALLPSVNSIAPYAGLANALIFFVIFIVIVNSTSRLATDGIGSGLVLAKPYDWPLFLATAIYSFEGITNVLPVENALEHKNDIFSITYITMAVVAVVYTGVGFASYLAWPDITKGSITAQLAEDHPNSGLLAASSWLVIIAVILTFPVQLFPAVDILELRLGLVVPPAELVPSTKPGGFSKLANEGGTAEAFDVVAVAVPRNPMAGASRSFLSEDEESERSFVGEHEAPSSNSTPSPAEEAPGTSWKQKVFRVLLVAFTWIIAATVPNLGALIALLGAATGSLLSIVLPSMIDYCCPREAFGLNPGRNFERYAINSFLIAFGVIGGLWATVMAFLQATGN